MIGHKQIIEYRKLGIKPSSVFIEAGRAAPTHQFEFDDPERALDWGLYPEVFIEDMKVRHDLRFLAGCMVQIHAKELNDDVLILADKVAALAMQVVLSDGFDIMINKNGEWTAYAN